MKLIHSLVLLFFIGLPYPVLSGETDMPAPDNPMPLPPMPPPDKPDAKPWSLMPLTNNKPLFINKGDLTVNEMHKLRKFSEQELHRKIQFQEK
ncbi:hypothetical protein [Neptunomonas sp. XY-337]|uniref:hypothetical protein n=1 Tax=Neptunomonas sp. XY-337 TaxID=2561897 RepID=UPI0010AA2DB6|nr:hypothetical protein [Neptunomonas sp. XY-337]